MSSDAIRYHIGQVLYLRIKPETAGMVTGIMMRERGHTYLVTWAHDMAERYHYEMELTPDRTFSEQPETP